MKAPQINDIVSGLQTVANGQPQALGQLVTQYAAGAAQQLVPAGLGQVAAALPLRLDGSALSLAPGKLEGTLAQVLGSLSPDALQTLQRLTGALPGGLAGLADPQAWFGQVGSHLLQEALPPQLQQFAAAGQEILLASAGPAALSDVPTGLWSAPAPTRLAAAPPAPANDEDQQTKDNKKAKKPPVKTGWLDAKKERYEQRLELIKKAEAKRKSIRNPIFGKAIDRLKFNNVAIERWRLSLDAYRYQIVTKPTAKNYAQAQKLGYQAVQYNKKAGQVLFKKGPPPEGWKVLRIFDDPATGLNAVLYQSSFEAGGKPVLAFAGTETNRIGGPMVPIDVAVDYNQAHMAANRSAAQERNIKSFNFSRVTSVPIDPQYAKAIALGQQIRNQYGGGITVTGHSLGGGLATAVSVVSDLKAYTFNAAGLHQDTVAPFGVSPADLQREGGRIEAFHTAGDELTNAQRTYQRHAIRNSQLPGTDVPVAAGNQRTIGKTGHMGQDIEQEFEDQKEYDVVLIKRILSSKRPELEKPDPNFRPTRVTNPFDNLDTFMNLTP